MTRMIAISYTALLVLIGILSLSGFGPKVPAHQMALSHVAAKTQIRLLVPAYFDPDSHPQAWSDLIEAAHSVPIIAIVNPCDGPGTSVNKAYKDEIDRARKAGVTVVGYVLTGGGSGPIDYVKTDISRWRDFYPNINGIFFDEQSDSNDNDKISFYKEIFAYARGKIDHALVIGNPGTTFPERYFSEANADIECIFESDKGFDTFSMPAWTGKYGPERFAVLPLDVPQNRLLSYLDRAVNLRVGNVYVTDDRLDNPWDRLPGYWKQEVDRVKALNK
jgi:hypothetical protein